MVRVLPLPLTSSVTLGMLLNVSEPVSSSVKWAPHSSLAEWLRTEGTIIHRLPSRAPDGGGGSAPWRLLGGSPVGGNLRTPGMGCPIS